MTEDIKKILEEILSSVKGLEERVARIEENKLNPEVFPQQIILAPKKMSLKEFLLDRAPTNGVQTTLAIAYYLEKYQDTSPFNTSDIEKGFRAAKEPIPTNINDKINMSIKNGHVMEAETKKDSMKAWLVTRSGEQTIETGFSKQNK